jgi:hypothetical protein
MDESQKDVSVMSELAIKAMKFAERMQDGPYVHLKEVRDLLNECSEAIDANETHEAMLNQMLDDKAALITELVGALENAQQYIPIDAVECRGDKCREPWCISCFGEDAAAKAIEDAGNHNRAIKEALTKAKGSEK